MAPQVSVIVPAYNVAAYIEHSLHSALAQAGPDFEILVVDDGSTDETAALVRGLADPRLRLLQNEHNRGLSPSRNRAVEQARGQWLALLDADDWWAAGRLARLLDVATAEQADFVADDMRIVPDGQADSPETLTTRRGLRLAGPVVVSPVHFTRWDLGLVKPLIRRQFLLDTGLRYDETMLAGEDDFPFQMRCLLQGARYIFVPDAYYFYRVRPGSLSSRRVRMFRCIKEATEELLAEPSVQRDPALAAALRDRARYAQAVVSYNQAKSALGRGRVAAACKSLYHNPGLVSFTLGRLARRGWRRLQRGWT